MVPRVNTQAPVKIISSCPESEVIDSTVSESLGKTFHTYQISKNVKLAIPSGAQNVGKLVEPHWRPIRHL